VEEAAAVADEVGYDKLTLAAVAQRRGVALPSLYKHVRGLDDLQQHLAALATSELADALGKAAIGRARGDALRALGSAYRGYARAHPGRYAATVRAPSADNPEHVAAATSAVNVVVAVLAGYGLSGDDAIDATRAVRSALHGFVAIEASGGFGMPLDVDRSFERMLDMLDSALSTWRG
jgi:AcrR family transcriptional regulator